MREEVVAKKRWMLVGLGVFLMMAALAVIVNSLGLGYGFNAAWSISRYVGMESWSVIAFALGNFFATWATARYMWALGRRWKMPRVYYYFAFLTGVGLVLLSVWPIGYFDTAAGKSVVSYGHELASRMMFLMMLLVTLMIVIKSWRMRKVGARGVVWSQLVAVLYILYGVVCIIGRVTKASWFAPYLLFYEGLYIAAFVVMLACQ